MKQKNYEIKKKERNFATIIVLFVIRMHSTLIAIFLWQ